MILSKTSKVFCNVIIVKTLAVVITTTAIPKHAGANTCDFKKVTNQCEFFKRLKPTDIIELPSGEKVPACTLSSVHSTEVEQAMAQIEENQVALRQYLASLPPASMSNTFKGFLEQRGFNNLASLTFASSRAEEMPWPPNQEGAPVRSVTLAEFVNHLRTNAGIEQNRIVELMRAADQNQNAVVAALMDTDQRGQYARTPAQTQAAFDRVKAETIEFLRQGKSDAELTPEIRSIIGRVNAYALANNTNNSGSICGPNRGSGGRNNTAFAYIELGPKMNYFPANTVQRTLAHEFAHSFDPCRSNNTVFQASPEFAQWVKEEQNVNNPRGVFGKVMPPGSEAALRGSEILGTPFTIDENPFRETYNCLINQASQGGRAGHPLNRGLGSFHMRSGASLAQVGPIQTEEQACQFTQGNEIFCDWVASQILEQMIKKDAAAAAGGSSAQVAAPPSKPKKSAPANSAQDQNVVRAPKGYEYMIYNLDEACAEEMSGRPMETASEHPSDRRRVNLILNNPTVAEAMGCERTPDSHVICPASQTFLASHAGAENSGAPVAVPPVKEKPRQQKSEEAQSVE